jgi:exodeoxyribonuclease-3
LTTLKQHNPAFKFISPIAVTGGEIDFTLFAIWANHPGDPEGRYVEQVWKAIHYYDEVFSYGEIVLTGDFNSNTIWDREHRVGNHSAVVEKLATHNIKSLYHHYFKQQQGKEKHPTFFLYRNIDKPYHLDYCFASETMLNLFKNLKIGSFKDWIEHSDHLPMAVEFAG